MSSPGPVSKCFNSRPPFAVGGSIALEVQKFIWKVSIHAHLLQWADHRCSIKRRDGYWFQFTPTFCSGRIANRPAKAGRRPVSIHAHLLQWADRCLRRSPAPALVRFQFTPTFCSGRIRASERAAHQAHCFNSRPPFAVGGSARLIFKSVSSGFQFTPTFCSGRIESTAPKRRF